MPTRLTHASSATSLAFGSPYRRKGSNPHAHNHNHHSQQHHPRAVFGSPRLLHTVYNNPLSYHASRRPLWVFSGHHQSGQWMMNHASWPPISNTTSSLTLGQHRQCQTTTLLSSSTLCLPVVSVGLLAYWLLLLWQIDSQAHALLFYIDS